MKNMETAFNYGTLQNKTLIIFFPPTVICLLPRETPPPLGNIFATSQEIQKPALRGK